MWETLRGFAERGVCMVSLVGFIWRMGGWGRVGAGRGVVGESMGE